jgi:hypothetical protein
VESVNHVDLPFFPFFLSSLMALQRESTFWWIEFSLRALWWIEFSLRALSWISRIRSFCLRRCQITSSTSEPQFTLWDQQDTVRSFWFRMQNQFQYFRARASDAGLGADGQLRPRLKMSDTDLCPTAHT